MTKFEEEFDKKVDIFNVIGNHNSMCCEVDQVKEVFKDWQPQQALPVVPECVGSFLTNKSILGIANGVIPDDVISWVQEQTYYVDLEKIISHLISLKVTGFKVEKPQLFYLKHIDMSKADKELDYYLAKEEDRTLSHDMPNKGQFPWHPESRFTQQEIDSMKTGSYEQIKVEDEK